MTNEQQLLKQLLSKDKLSDSDKHWLLDYLHRTNTGELRSLLLERFGDDLTAGANIDAAASQQIWQKISSHKNRAQTPVHSPAKLRPLPRTRVWWAAAAVFILLCAGAYLLSKQSPGSTSPSRPQLVQTIPAGRQGALLTLADGSQVQLDTIQNTSITLEGGVTAKVVNGELVYEGNGNTLAYNTVSTPKGRQYTVTLPDGTKVWLNSASSIRYPIVFTTAERSVKITGEAYLEVAPHPAQPFLVNINDRSTITVLGTHFNVNAYDNETSVTTTLLQGAVRVANNGSPDAATLLPGQQAQMIPGAQHPLIRVTDHADLEKVIAWKNGLFNFEHASLAEIMRQLERWYDIEVVYENTIPNIALRGEITRDVPLTELLAALKKMGLHYKLEGRRLLIGH